MKPASIIPSLAAPCAALAVQTAAPAAPAPLIVPATFQEMVPMRDGARLFTYGTKPPKGEKVPIIVVRTPYVEEDSPTEVAAFAATQFPAMNRGYACVVQHCRGCGRSEGDWIPFEHEREDGLDLLDWIRRLPWYNGELFLSGGSYLAAVHWAYLDTNPPDVKGAILNVMSVDRYDISYRNGFFKVGLFADWTVPAYCKKDKSLKRDASVKPTDFPLCDFARRYWGVEEPSFANMMAHPDHDDPFWKSDAPGSGASSRRGLLDSTMPILIKTSAFDLAIAGILNMWRETPPERLANCALLIDAYEHSGMCSGDMKGTLAEFPLGARINSPEKDLDWFDYCRGGKPCDWAPPGRLRYYALWENKWHVAKALRDGPRRIDIPLGKGTFTWRYDPRRPAPEFPGSGGHGFPGMRLQPPPDFRDDVVSFLLPPTEGPIDARGQMRASLAVASNCEDTCFYVRVSVGKGDGQWYLLRDDISSPCAGGRDYAPGTETRIDYVFPAIAFRLEKGDILRVDVASATPQFYPHGNVRGNQSEVREPRVARNSIRAEASTLTIFAKGRP